MVGTKAPTFSLEDKDGNSISLDSIDEKYVVIFFYPKDDTPGCTIEAKGFTEYSQDFKKKDTFLVGISGGDQNSKQKFCSKHDLDVCLLSDSDFSVAKEYQAYGEKSFMGKKFNGIFRKTLILNKEREVIAEFNSVKPKVHPQEVLEYITDLEN